MRREPLTVLTLLVTLLSVPPATAAVQVFYVDIAAGVDAPAGGTPGQPWKTIPYALGQVSGTAVDPVELRIAQGTYTGTVTMEAWVDLLGGYQAATWINDPKTYVSRLDGGGISRVVYCADNAQLDGFVVTGGNVTGLGEAGNGGGIYCDGTSPVITNNIIAGNQARFAGAGLVARESSLVLRNNVFVRNVGGHAGSAFTIGSIFGGTPPTPIVEGNLVLDNVSTDLGGPVEFVAVDATFSKNSIVGNVGDDDIISAREAGGVWSNNEMAGNDGNGDTSGDGALIRSSADSTFRLINNTLVGGHDPALLVTSSVSGSPQHDVVNNIFAGHTLAIEELHIDADVFPLRNLFFDNTTVFLNEADAEYADANALNMHVDGAAGNVSGDPLFQDWPSFPWTAAGVYDSTTFTTLLTDTLTIPGGSGNGLAGWLVNPDVSQQRVFFIKESTSTTLTVWGDASAVAPNGATYYVERLRLNHPSAAVDRGDLADTDLPPDDIEGEPRPGSDALVDIGADEAPSSYVPATDGSPPVSQIVDLPTFHSTHTFGVPWVASDAESGLDVVRLFYRLGGSGSFVQFGGDFTASPIPFTSPLGEGSYAMYTVAIDNSSNVEAPPATADAVTLVRTSFAGSVVYVHGGATGAGTGESWADAVPLPSQGLLMAGTFGVPQVWVAAGSYLGPLSLVAGVELYGGFAGAETSLGQRDPWANPTVLDGAGVSRVVYCADNARLDGFVVTGGNVTGLGDAGDGGGIYCVGTSPVIANNVIAGNHARFGGAGLLAHESSLVLRNNVFVRNVGGHSGSAFTIGSIYGGTLPTPVVEGNLVLDNVSTDLGGPVEFVAVDATFSKNSIVGNVGDDDIISAREAGGVWSNNEMAGNDGNGDTSGNGALIRSSDDSTFRLVNNTLVGGHDPALLLTYSVRGNPQHDLVNNIFAGHVLAIEELHADSDAYPVNNLFFGNTNVFYNEAATEYADANALNMHVEGAAANMAGDPAFQEGASYPWTADGVYDPVTFTTMLVDTLTIPGATGNGLAGWLVNPDVSQQRLFMIKESTNTSLTVWGDASAVSPTGATYRVEALRLDDPSAAADRGTPADPDLPLDDIDGELRPGNDALVDIGADEAPSNYLPPNDTLPPASQVVDLPTFHSSPTFAVPWVASDAESGLSLVRLFYRFGGSGPFAQFGGDFTASPIPFTSPLGEGSYEMYTAAVDNSANVEAPPATPDAVTLVRTSFAGSVIHVDADATGGQTGESWANALALPSQGLLMAGTFGIAQVWVAEGTYLGPISLISNVELYGGFAGTEMSLGQRDPWTNPTVLDGAGVSRVVYCADDARLDGFVVTGGNVTGLGDAGDGGGIYCVGTSPVIANNVIAGNHARFGGAGLLAHESSLVLRNNVFVRNVGGHAGSAFTIGSIFGGTPPTPIVEGNLVLDNVSTDLGGPVEFVAVDATFSKNSIVGNVGDDDIISAREVGGVWSNNEMAGNDGNGGTSGDGALIRSFDDGTFRLVNNTLVGGHDPALLLTYSLGGGAQHDLVNNIFVGHVLAIEEFHADADAYPVNNLFFGNTVDFRDETVVDYTGAAAVNANVGGAADNLTGDPVLMTAPGGAWTAVGIYDPATFTTQLTDALTISGGAANGLAGWLVNPDVSQQRMFVIKESTNTTLTVWGDASAIALIGSGYGVESLHIVTGSAARSQASILDPDLPAEDIDGDPRPGNDAGADIGSDEADNPSIGDRVWEDRDADGIQDPGEPGIVSALVYLFGADSVILDVTFTDTSGRYVFTDLTAGSSYFVRFIPPPGYVLSPMDQGGDDSIDSDADPATGDSPIISPGVQLGPYEWDAGMVTTVPCFAPDEPIYVYGVRLSTDGNEFPILDFMDFNQPDQVTGYHVYRSSETELPAETWPLVATDIVDGDQATPNNQWVDTSGDVSPSDVWYYQITAFNNRCPAEGPR